MGIGVEKRGHTRSDMADYRHGGWMWKSKEDKLIAGKYGDNGLMRAGRGDGGLPTVPKESGRKGTFRIRDDY